MKRLRRVLKNKNGNGLLWACVIVLALLLIFAAVSEYLRLQMIVKGVRDGLESSINSVAIANYDDVYNGLREGYSGGYFLTTSDQWQSKVDTGSVFFQLDKTLGLVSEDGGHVKEKAEGYEYKLSDLKLDIKNAPLAPNQASEVHGFSAEGEIMVEVPLSFGWDMLPPLQLKLHVKAGYTPKF